MLWSMETNFQIFIFGSVQIANNLNLILITGWNFGSYNQNQVFPLSMHTVGEITLL